MGSSSRTYGVPAIRARRDRLIPAGLALLLAFALPGYTLAAARQDLPPLLGVEVGGLVLLGLTLAVKLPRMAPLAIILLGAPVALVVAQSGTGFLAPWLGVDLLAVAELTFWSLDLAAPGRSTARLRRALWLRLAVLAVVGGGIGWLVLAVAGLQAAGTLDLTVLGVAATLGILGLMALLVRSAVGSPPRPRR